MDLNFPTPWHIPHESSHTHIWVFGALSLCGAFWHSLSLTLAQGFAIAQELPVGPVIGVGLYAPNTGDVGAP